MQTKTDHVAAELRRKFRATPDSEKIGLVDSMLLASGWTCEPEGWLAPANFRDELAQVIGEGHITRWFAISVQVQFDEGAHKAMLAKLAQSRTATKPSLDSRIAHELSLHPGHRHCNTCPFDVGDTHERDCSYPDCSAALAKAGISSPSYRPNEQKDAVQEGKQ